MTTIIFTNQRIEDGAELVARLREILPITAVFWVNDTEKLIIASPWVDERGALAVYKAIHQVTLDFPTDIYAVSPNDSVAAQLAALGNFAGPFKAFLDGFCPSSFYIEEGADSVTGYAYSLDAPSSNPNPNGIPPAPPSPPRFGKPTGYTISLGELLSRGKK